MFNLVLKSLTSDPVEILTVFFLSYAELHNRGDIVKSYHRNGGRKQKIKQSKITDAMGAQKVINPCALSW